MKRRVKVNTPLAGRIAASVEAAALELMHEDEEALDAISGGDGIVVHEDGTIQLGSFYITSVGLYMDDAATFEDWERFGFLIKKLRKVLNLAFLDHLAAGRKYGDLKALAEQFGYRYETLKDYLWVVTNVQLSIRIDNLTLAHYRVVAPYSENLEYQRYWLQAASRGDGTKPWSKSQLELMMLQYPNGLPSGLEAAPAPSRRRDPLERFNKTIEPFELKLRKIAHKAGPQSRAEMAQKLEDLARDLRGGEGE